MNEVVDIYTDGSFIEEKTKWALIVVGYGNHELHRERGCLEGEICKLRQVGGELKAAIQAIVYCRKHGKKAHIIYDYKGVACWVGHVFGGEKWNANNEWSQKYRDFVIANKEHIHGFTWVKGHSGVHWNEECDLYAKGA